MPKLLTHSGCQKFLPNEGRFFKRKSPMCMKFFLDFLPQSTMAPSTPPPQAKKSPDADTIIKTRFFHAIDHRLENVTIKDVCEQESIKLDRGKYWLKQRQRLEDVAYRRRSRSGRPKKVSTQLINQMLDPHTNSVRDQPYTVQLEHFHIDVTRRTLQRAFSARKPRAARF